MRRHAPSGSRSSPMTLRTVYLIFYNVLQGAGWTIAVAQTIWVLVSTQDYEQVYNVAGPCVKILQLVALLETVHAATGLVKGSPGMAFLQWFGRSNVLFLILNKIHPVQYHPAVASMFIAWGLADMIRYPWYAISLVKTPPYWLTWLRYSAFIVLYPWGMFLGEWPIVYTALPAIKWLEIWSISMPNAWNFAFSYYYFCWVGLVFIMPGGLIQLYIYMLSHRRRRLRRAPVEDKVEDSLL